MNSRGYILEEKVAEIIGTLGRAGLARDIEKNLLLKDRDGNERKIDVAFTLITDIIDIRVAIECKSRDNPLTLDEVDQIKTFAREIPERNIFWLVTEAGLNSNASRAMRLSGISHYTLVELAERVESIVERHGALRIAELRGAEARFKSLHAGMMSMTQECLIYMNFELYTGQIDILTVLWSYVQEDKREAFRNLLDERWHFDLRKMVLGS